MKYCHQCGRYTGGDPLFCNRCGRSYDVRLCPRLHPNPRYAEVCSQCGSAELSTAQPKVSFWWRVVEFLAKVFLGLVLGYLSIAFLLSLLRRPEVQAGVLVLAVLLGVLWWLWSQLPEWFRRLIRRRRKEDRRDWKR
jgi:uncharacterized membrane protein YcjF (UPF0283 family)